MAGRVGGVPLEQTGWQAIECRDGKVSWWATFRTEHEALEAVTLREEAMSQENVENIETVRRCLDALNRRDLDGYLACCTDDVELRTALVALEGEHEGRDGIRRFFADVQDTAPDFQLALERVEVVGRNKVLSFERGTASGRTSGVAVEKGIPLGTVYDFAEGKVERIRVFAEREQALEAAGLSK